MAQRGRPKKKVECEFCGKSLDRRGYRNHMVKVHGVDRYVTDIKKYPIIPSEWEPLEEEVVLAPPPSQDPTPLIYAAQNLFDGDTFRSMAFVLMAQEPLTRSNLEMAASYLRARAKELPDPKR